MPATTPTDPDVTAFARTISELADAAGEARRAWSRRAWLETAVLAVVLLLPLVLPSDVAVDRLAHYTYLAAAAVALGLLVGPGGMPSLCQGVFVGIGAVCSAHLHDAPLLVAVAAGAAAGAVAGAGVGAAFARLRPVYLAAATWLTAWGFALLLATSSRIAGGAQGLVVESRRVGGLELTPTVHFEIGVCLVVVAVLGIRAVRRSALGLQLEGVAASPAVAAAVGVPRPRARTQAFALSGSVAGLAGALSVYVALVADPTAYGPFLSFELLVACLVGGAASPVGPVVGIAVVALTGPVGDALGELTGAETARFGTMLSALLVLAILASGTGGIVPAIERSIEGRSTSADPATSPRRPRARADHLEARGLAKRFGSYVALAGLDLDLGPGRVVALVGPNGSGKSTALRLLSGSVAADGGHVRLGARELDGLPAVDRVRLGIVRTLQRPPVFGDLTALEAVAVGAAAELPTGAARAFFATPTSRANGRGARAEARAALAVVGLADVADAQSAGLTGIERHLVAIAAALATRPGVLLLDEPGAGAGRAEAERLEDVLRRLRDDGLALLVVEHNLRLVRNVADTVVVLDQGSVLASGPPSEIAADPRVLAAYLGRPGSARSASSSH